MSTDMSGSRNLFSSKTLRILLLLGAAVLVTVSLFWPRLERAYWVSNLFSGKEQYHYFHRMTDMFPYATMSASPTPYQLPISLDFELPETFRFKDKDLPLMDFIEDTDTSALLVLHNGTVVSENYWLTGGPNTQWISMSVAKSFIGTGVGIAVDEGLIDIERAITDYVPILNGSGYDGVKVVDILQMSSGARWSEVYSDPDSEITRSSKLLAFGGSYDEFVASIPSEYAPGTVLRYNSMDTQVLAMLIRRASGRTVTEFLEEKLWHPLGMEHPGHWLLDSADMELGYFGLNATARDYAKLGELYRNNGLSMGTQVISNEWIYEATHPSKAHLTPDPDKGRPLGYGYQWWIPPSNEGEFVATGVYHQFIYVNPTRNVVIVKLSADSNYAFPEAKEKASREEEHFYLFNDLARAVSQE